MASRGPRPKKDLVTIYMRIPRKTHKVLVSKAEQSGKKISRVIREALDALAAHAA